MKIFKIFLCFLLLFWLFSPFISRPIINFTRDLGSPATIPHIADKYISIPSGAKIDKGSVFTTILWYTEFSDGKLAFTRVDFSPDLSPNRANLSLFNGSISNIEKSEEKETINAPYDQTAYVMSKVKDMRVHELLENSTGKNDPNNNKSFDKPQDDGVLEVSAFPDKVSWTFDTSNIDNMELNLPADYDKNKRKKTSTTDILVSIPEGFLTLTACTSSYLWKFVGILDHACT